MKKVLKLLSCSVLLGLCCVGSTRGMMPPPPPAGLPSGAIVEINGESFEVVHMWEKKDKDSADCINRTVTAKDNVTISGEKVDGYAATLTLKKLTEGKKETPTKPAAQATPSAPTGTGAFGIQLRKVNRDEHKPNKPLSLQDQLRQNKAFQNKMQGGGSVNMGLNIPTNMEVKVNYKGNTLQSQNNALRDHFKRKGIVVDGESPWWEFTENELFVDLKSSQLEKDKAKVEANIKEKYNKILSEANMRYGEIFEKQRQEEAKKAEIQRIIDIQNMHIGHGLPKYVFQYNQDECNNIKNAEEALQKDQNSALKQQQVESAYNNANNRIHDEYEKKVWNLINDLRGGSTNQIFNHANVDVKIGNTVKYELGKCVKEFFQAQDLLNVKNLSQQLVGIFQDVSVLFTVDKKFKFNKSVTANDDKLTINTDVKTKLPYYLPDIFSVLTVNLSNDEQNTLREAIRNSQPIKDNTALETKQQQLNAVSRLVSNLALHANIVQNSTAIGDFTYNWDDQWKYCIGYDLKQALENKRSSLLINKELLTTGNAKAKAKEANDLLSANLKNYVINKTQQDLEDLFGVNLFKELIVTIPDGLQNDFVNIFVDNVEEFFLKNHWEVAAFIQRIEYHYYTGSIYTWYKTYIEQSMDESLKGIKPIIKTCYEEKERALPEPIDVAHVRKDLLARKLWHFFLDEHREIKLTGEQIKALVEYAPVVAWTTVGTVTVKGKPHNLTDLFAIKVGDVDLSAKANTYYSGGKTGAKPTLGTDAAGKLRKQKATPTDLFGTVFGE